MGFFAIGMKTNLAKVIETMVMGEATLVSKRNLSKMKAMLRKVRLLRKVQVG